MEIEDRFYSQLGKTIQAWLWIETEAYLLYSAFMRCANSHLVSVTFNRIQSFEAKLRLLDNCLALILGNQSEEWKTWRRLFNRAEKLNRKRNKIVHEPAVLTVNGNERSMAIKPSALNALAVAKGQTTHTGPIVPSSYDRSSAQLLDDHKVDLVQLRKLENAFKDFSRELAAFRASAEPLFKQWIE
jgi:hypothetical protein